MQLGRRPRHQRPKNVGGMLGERPHRHGRTAVSHTIPGVTVHRCSKVAAVDTDAVSIYRAVSRPYGVAMLRHRGLSPCQAATTSPAGIRKLLSSCRFGQQPHQWLGTSVGWTRRRNRACAIARASSSRSHPPAGQEVELVTGYSRDGRAWDAQDAQDAHLRRLVWECPCGAKVAQLSRLPLGWVGMLSCASYCWDAPLCLLPLGCSIVPPTVGMLNCASYRWDAQLCLLLLGC
jgi:hypothetical protein